MPIQSCYCASVDSQILRKSPNDGLLPVGGVRDFCGRTVISVEFRYTLSAAKSSDAGTCKILAFNKVNSLRLFSALIMPSFTVQFRARYCLFGFDA